MNLITKLLSRTLVFCTVFSMNAAFADMTIEQAVNAEHREDRIKRDIYRNPKETLEFFGLKNNMTIVEVSPGGGWYMDILAPLVKDNGLYYGAHFYVDETSNDYFKKSRTKFDEKIKTDPNFNKVIGTSFHPTKALELAPEGSADMVLVFRNIHGWYRRHGDKGVDNAFGAFYTALKSGGILGVVQHRLPEDRDQVAYKDSGYIKQSYVIAAAKKAGFKLAATSEINANPKDTADHPKGVWTLPPSLSLGEENKEKYLTIGESDRMTLKFIKP